MTLREALILIDRKKLYDILCKLEKYKSDTEYTPEQCQNAYEPVIETLINYSDECAYATNETRLSVTYESDDHEYADVSIVDDLLYPGEKVSLGGSHWSSISLAKIENNTNLDLPTTVAEILWELTFDGWTEAQQSEFYKNLSTICNETLKQY